MNIWDTFRRFSGKGKKRRGQLSGSRGKSRETAGSLRSRGLRMEQFEERMLLSISTPSWLGNHTYMSDAVVEAVGRVVDIESYAAEDLEAVTQWVVGLESASGAALKADSLGAEYISAAPYLNKMSIWEFSDGQNWQTVVNTLDSAEGVDFFYPLVSQDTQFMMIPNDTLFDDQWHLLNTGQNGGTAGADSNVVPAWDFVDGTGVVLGIVDAGFEADHPDLADNYRTDIDWDYGQDDDDPSPLEGDNHGVAVAGVAAAVGNNATGVSGAAPNADLVGIRIDFSSNWSDATEASALTHENQTVDIYNNSWGSTAYYYPTGPLTTAALEYAVQNGRGGLGSIYVFAAGNSRMEDGNSGYDGESASRYTIAVAAIDHNGQYSYYSNPGASLLISAYSNSIYSGITTTDRQGDEGYNAEGEDDGDYLEDVDYTSTFGGTSSAAPLVSGVIALILEANPNLTYRDVQSILVNTARMTDPGNPDWTTNGAGYNVNHNYGFGAIDAAAAVNAALTWENLSEEIMTQSGLVPVASQIPDAGAVGMVSSTTLNDSVTDIEWVEVTVDIEHMSPGDLEIVLTSPSGTESVLSESSEQWWMFNEEGLENWTFTSARHWGESSQGEWTLQVRDKVTGFSGTWNSWSIKAYGENITNTPGPGPEPEPVVGPELISVVPNSGTAINDGDVLHTGPRELKFIFNEGQAIDEATLSAVKLIRAGGDGILDNANDVVVDYGWIGIGGQPNEIVVRFADTLPDDLYRITIVGAGNNPLTNDNGTVFNQGEDVEITFDLDLGALVTAVVPQPTWRDAAGDLHQDRDKVAVYFSGDTLDEASAENADFYRLTITGQTADTADDVEVAPQSVEYDPVANTVTLTFADDLADYGAGAFHLRIGNEYREIETDAQDATTVGDTFFTATNLGMLGSATTAASLIVSSEIEPLPYDLQWPGAITDVGQRDLPYSSYLESSYYERYFAEDSQYGIATIAYNFKDVYGYDPSGNPLQNLISPKQKDRAREVMELYAYYLGIQVVETAEDGLTIATGDMRAINPYAPDSWVFIADISEGVTIMDAETDWNESLYGGEESNWFACAMQGIGHLLGLGYINDTDPVTVMGGGDNGEYYLDSQYYVSNSELIYPGNQDIIAGQYLYRPDSTDVDIYRFNVEQAGTFSAETIAERLDETSLLDSQLKLYDDANNLIAANDDYYSEDSYVEVYLEPGTYYIAVSSTGNNQYDPDVEGSGIGGTTQGDYDLRVSFTPDVGSHLSDATGTWLDGDADGTPGGVYNFWFNVQSEANTIFVDKVADGPLQDGSLANPYTQIDDALAAASPDDIVRIVGNYDRLYNTQSQYTNGELSSGLAVGDLNGDGWDDIVSTTQNDLDDRGFVSILFGVGDGTFWAPQTYEIGENPTAVALGDITGDGMLDILVANGDENTLSRLDNLGDGTFMAMPKLFVGNGPVALELGDLNNDGDLDIVAANAADNSVSVLLSNGQGGYRDQDVHYVGNLPSALALGDFDNNQRIDIAVANSGDDTINIILNEENARTHATQFAVQSAIAVGNNPTSLAAGDLTGDGTVDIVVVNTGDNNISVLSGSGDGTFTATNYAAGSAPSAVDIAKLDNNDTLDVVVSSSLDDTVSVFFTLADGTMETPDTYSVGNAPGYLVLSDVDNDGTADIVANNTQGNTISVLLDHRDAAYEIGYDILNRPLEDGWRMEVPQGVTVMVDAGAVFKLRKANIDVGSSAQGVDRSEGALQILGTPDLNVYFTSYHNKLMGEDHSQFDVPAAGGDWGGIVIRNKLDYEYNESVDAGNKRVILEEEGIFLNYVNHANITYGGGQVAVNSVSEIYNPLHMEESRPTLTYNTITKNADAAMSADPNSFADTKFQGDTYTADYDRVGPEIYGNYIVDNSINGIFVRIETNAGKSIDELEVCARWDDIDIVHVVLENLIISGTPGGPVDTAARLDGRLAIDPGVIVKLDSTRIEAEVSSQLIAEGTDSLPVVFTSLNDSRYGMGGTFDSNNNGSDVSPAPGDWGGLYFAPTSSGSIDNALIAFGGGSTPIQGRFANFNTVEIHQAEVRIADSVFEYNTSNATGDDFRNGRNTATDALIFVRGAQPVIVGNTIWNNDAPAISIDANSMQAVGLIDWGRSRGETEAYDEYQDNNGPLFAENHFSNNELNGLLVRGATLTTSSIWDDTDIVHILQDEIVIPNHHTYSGLRLQSSADESLVVKLLGTNAGFTALGTPQEIDDRVGGTLQIIGMPGFPVVLTSLSDDSYGAGYDPWGDLQTDTDNASRTPAAGDWRSVKLEEYVNDRNVAVVNEMEPASGIEDDANDAPSTAEDLGSLAWNESSGDDNLRLGFDVNGFIRSDDSSDTDIFSFSAEAGVEIWIDIDRTTLGLDSVIELVDANGNVYARSDNSEAERTGEEGLYGLARSMDRDTWYINDQYTTNPKDAGMRVVLPGPTGQTRTYYIRVSSANGASSGAYQLQVRLREEQEFAGSYINMSSIHYATNGIEMLGLPTSSPLVGTYAEVDRPGTATAAWADITPEGAKNNMRVAASMNGEGFNGVEVEFVDGSTTGNSAVATYNAATLTLSVDINPNETTGAAIVAAINAEGTFGAVLIADGEEENDGSGKVNETGLMGTLANGMTGGNNDFSGAEYVGNLLYSDQGALQISGYMDGASDIDWYAFDIDLQKVQDDNIQWPTVFDIDYADGMARPDLAIWVYDSTGRLIYASDDSNLADDRSGPTAGADTDDLDRGSLGPFDPYLGTVLLPEGDNMRYYVAVTTQARVPTALDQASVRLEPVTSITRVAEDHIINPSNTNIDPDDKFPELALFNSRELDVHVEDYGLNDVVLYVCIGDDIYTIDPYTGELETDVTGPLAGQLLPDSYSSSAQYGDIAMRSDGQLYTFVSDIAVGGDKDSWMRYRQISTESSGTTPAHTKIYPDGQYNDIYIQANSVYAITDDDTGAVTSIMYNGVSVVFVQGDNVTAEFDEDAMTLTVSIVPETTTAQMVIDAINAEGTFSASLIDYEGNDGSGIIANYGAMGTLDGAVLSNAPLAEQVTGINTYVFDANLEVQETAAEHISFQAMAHSVSGSTRYVYAIGSFETGGANGGLYTENLLYKFNADGTAIQKPGVEATERVPSDIIPLASLSTGGAKITGMTFMEGTLYAVDEAGGFYTIDNYDSYDLDAIENVDPAADPNAVEVVGGGAALTPISNLGVPFSGLTLGPQNVEDGAYSQMLFATTSDGKLYALDATGTFQPVFLNGQTSIQLGGITNPIMTTTGLAFSTLDYNLWHVTESRDADVGHGVDISPDDTRVPTNHDRYYDDYSHTGESSFWFGLEQAAGSPNAFKTGASATVSIPGASGQDTKTYNLPGGAHGTLTTNTFSLAGSDAQDIPMLYFNYFLETDENDGQVTDSARVYVSYNGADWTMLASNILTPNPGFPEYNPYSDVPDYNVFNLEDSTGNWQQAQIDMSDYVEGLADSFGSDEAALNEALSGLRLKFEFSTAGSMNIGAGDIDTLQLFEGGYLRAAAGNEFIHGDYFEMADLVTSMTTRFEFDMGFSLLAAASAGQRISDGDTLTVGGTVYEFSKDPNYNTANNPIFISNADSASSVASKIAQSVPDAIAVDGRVYLGNATTVSVASAGLTREGDAPGSVGLGSVAVPITPEMTATEVAEAMALAIDSALAATDDPNYYQTIKLDEDLLQTVGYLVSLDSGSPLAYSDSLSGDNPSGGYTTSEQTQAYWQRRGEDNRYEGFYIDDVIIGYAEHGEMVTGAEADTGFKEVPTRLWTTDITKGPSIVEGAYQLEIRTGTDYASHYAFRSVDTNDRLTDALNIEAPAACDLVHGATFTVNDGVYEQTFQFYNETIGYADADKIGISFEGDESASEMATKIAGAINAANLLLTTASSNAGSSVVYLADAASVVDITTQTFNYAGANASVVKAEDLNGDGLAEIVTANQNDGTISVLVGDASTTIPTWGLPTFYSVGAMPTDMEIADVNGDSLLDIVTSNARDCTVSVLLGNGDGTFAQQTVYEVGHAPSALTLADVDGNRILDIITANKGDDTVSILYGIGGGVFMPHDDHAVGSDPMDVVAVDLDGNGMLDIVTANSLDNTISVLYEAGLTSFAPQKTFEVGGIPVSLATADLDGTNGADIVVANRGDGTATVLLNDGTGAFMPGASNQPMGQGPTEISLADLDGDAMLDIIAVNKAADTITLAYGTALGTFEDAYVLPFDSTNPVSCAFINLGLAQAVVAVSADSDYAIAYSANGRGLDYLGALPISTSELGHLNGDDNEERAQGQIIIAGNEITDVLAWGIKYDSGARDGDDANLAHPGSVLPLVEINEQRLVPGVTIENNLMATCRLGGILFSGDANSGDVPTAAVPFGRILNNTIYGDHSGTGIMVEENASPTVLNNVIAATNVGISVDATSQTTVLGANAYQGNTIDVSGMALGEYDMVLDESDPLFVDAESGNFYPAAGSPIIDSSLNSLEDRPALAAVRDQLGIAESPIIAPETDLLGQSRADDLTVSPPLGMGRSVFKDRGAYDRLDFIGPTATLLNPLDNDSAGQDKNPADNDVFVKQNNYTEFVIQLADVAGVGIADSTVVESTVSIYVDDSDQPLLENRDYFFSYDVNTDQITLVPALGIWESSHEYKIVLDNSATGIRDIADNPLRGNRLDKSLEFNIALGHIDYGDAPDPTYQTLLENDGARHLLIGGFYLGEGVTSEADAQFTLDGDGMPIWNASGDQMDDGVEFGSALVINGDVTLTVTASKNGGYLDAWIDFNADGDWNDTGEHIFVSQLLSQGENTLTITIPTEVIDDDGIDNTVDPGATFARFRYSSDSSGLEPFGEASDGEVEDYRVIIVDALQDFGDAPSPYPTLYNEDDNLSGAYHALSVGGLHLGDTVDDELDGQPNAHATGDDNDSPVDDEDGVVAENWFVPGQSTDITVTASDAGYLNAWFDFNADGDWDDAGEQIFVGLSLQAGSNLLSVPVPGDAVAGATYARFRFSSTQILGPTGPAIDGEVEDYEFLISSTPHDYGDAPLSYPTMMNSGAASLAIEQAGENNDFLVTAAVAGTNFNGVEIVIANEMAEGDEALVVYSVVDKRLTIYVDSEATTAETVIDAVNDEGTFIATLMSTNDTGNDGTGLVSTLGNFGETSGGFNGDGNDAASHVLGSGLYLGSSVDAELDGQASPAADGDDTNGMDDEDGVVFNGLITGQESAITVTAAFNGVTDPVYLNAWIDFNQDGVWTANEQVLNDRVLADGENILTVNIPGDAEEGFTFARFRISTDAGLSFTGTASDGEVEDYRVEIERGNASVSGYKFDDRDNDGVWDANEPGIAGVKIYVDIDGNGELNTDAYGNPTEPYTFTIVDDLSTVDVDETGLYEFRGLMGRQEPYIVREISQQGWIQTYPNATVSLPDGSFGNDDGSYTLYLTESENITDANFGNFCQPTFSIADIKVAEGDAGYTDIEVVVSQKGSFGDTISLHYWTEDGTAIAASGDYQVSDGTLTFPARSTPARPWDQEILTKGFTNESVFHTSGEYVVWQGRASASDDWEIYLFDGMYDSNGDPNIIQLTDNDTDDTNPFVVQTASGGVNVVWEHQDEDGGVPTDTEIYLYDGSQSIALTDNTYDDRDPQVSDTHVTWWGSESLGLDSEVFLYEIASGDPINNAINLSDNDENDFSPQISGDMVVWTGQRSGKQEIILYDGTGTVEEPRVEQLTTYSGYANTEPRIDGNTIVWQRDFGSDNYEIYMYEVDPGGAIGTPTRLTNNSVPDRYPQVSGSDIVWQAKDGSYINDWEIMHYNTISQADPVQITNNDTYDQRPRISGTQVVWQAFDIANWEVFTYELRGEDGIQNVSQNSDSDWYPQVADSMIVWRNSGDEDALIIARAGDPVVTQTVTLRIIGDTTNEADENFFLHIEAASSESQIEIIKSTSEIMILNDDPNLDYGDAPDSYYPTLVSNDGARHLTGSAVYLCDVSQPTNLAAGAPDSEADGRSSDNADGDDLYISDDENGVSFDNVILPDGYMEFTVVASTASVLNAWIDFNADGDWDDSWGSDHEHMLDDVALVAGENTFSIHVPAGAPLGQTYARFRVTASDYTDEVDYTGYIDHGEVEDYCVQIGVPTAATSQSFAMTDNDGDDSIEFIAGDVLQLVINGQLQEYTPEQGEEIVLDAGLGYDTVVLRGSEDDETFELWTGQGFFQGNGYSLRITGAESITANSGGGTDSVTMHDSDGDDLFELTPDVAQLVGAEFSLRAESFGNVTAIADGQGDDVAEMYDSAGDDTFTADYNTATLKGEGFQLDAAGFETVRSHANEGGFDMAVLNDSAANDTAVASPTYAKLYDGTFYIEANSFDHVRVFADAGGYNTATLLDSADDDTLMAGPTYAKMYVDDVYYYCVDSFDRVTARSEAGGSDTAHLHDSVGDDTFAVTPTMAKMQGDGFYIKAENFATVSGYGNRGGFDKATLKGSDGDDSFVVNSNYGKLTGQNFTNWAIGFEEVEAYGEGGEDKAMLYDSVHADFLEAAGDWASLSTEELDLSFLVRAFKQVEANSSSTGDQKDVEEGLEFLFAKGLWEDF